MATSAASSSSGSSEDRRKRVILMSDLPADFLRVGQATCSNDESAQIESDKAAAMALQRELAGEGQIQGQGHVHYTNAQPAMLVSSFIPPNTRGRLSVTIVEARLGKNYGLVRMDPYCRMRVGTTVFETPTDANGSKTPKWNRTVHCYLPEGIDSVYVEVFDERAFSMDERIAWAHVPIPKAVENRETIDDWYALSGALGEGKEGMVNLVMAFAPVNTQTQTAHPQAQSVAAAAVPVPSAAAAAATGGPVYSEQDVADIAEILPNLDKELIQSVLQEKHGNKQAAMDELLVLSQ